MKVTFFENPTPHLLLENVFTDQELDLVWKEIDFLHSNFVSGETTSPAFDTNTGEVLKKNMGLFLYDIYADPSYSNIINYTNGKLYGNKYLAEQWKIPWMKESFLSVNWDAALISYYENSDYYKPHCDGANFTSLIWIWKEPKSFEGGDFFLDNHSHEMKVKNNCGIVFLSAEKHSVSSVKMTKKTFENYGRYCISSFCGIGMK